MSLNPNPAVSERDIIDSDANMMESPLKVTKYYSCIIYSRLYLNFHCFS